MSFAGAESIEKNSWQNTWLLVDTEEIETVKIEQPSIALENETPAESTKDAKIMIESASSSPKAETDEPQRAFLRAALVGNKEAMRRVAADAFLPAETLAERINELFLEKIGDVVFEIADGGIALELLCRTACDRKKKLDNDQTNDYQKKRRDQSSNGESLKKFIAHYVIEPCC